MSGSETGVMTSREPFLQASPLQSLTQSQSQSMRLDYTSGTNAIYKPVTAATSPPPYQSTAGAAAAAPGDSSTGVGAVMSSGQLNMNMGGEPMKRKRGRPRKYGPDGTMSLALSPSAQSAAVPVNQSSGGFSPPPPPPPPAAAASGGAASPTTSTKKARGRPPGSTNTKKQQLEALGSAGMGFTPHVITVKAGEDVSSKIMSFSQNGPRAVCILSANGAISNVTLRQAATSGGTVTYEGRFEILSLSGSFLLSEIDGQRSRTGGLSVSLSSSDGRVLGGCVAGLLTAACPVQVVVGSFAADGRKEPKTEMKKDPSSAGPRLAAASGPNGVSSPPSHGTLSESSGGQGSPLNQSTGAGNNNNPQGMSSMSWK
ncbi:putative PPC domain, AT hook, DNA-binding protein [Rosa chinensis]|uniref:AT-hook motif nuclear-localized protein n=2 Tax=Magnoliopsida TaxID=3398 RepID=A0A2P6PBU2_ROSCH|nr:AT-hook motif nuclear-localized protein 10 [Rosa chinensis]XP_040367921.1 AT-hook motif nuclear-localized protein 10 [Rosa chinensis]PRQ19388.1 putative PPC domain, AT hook, DNA-binding protein [Rosa chinensis]